MKWVTDLMRSVLTFRNDRISKSLDKTVLVLQLNAS